MIQRRDAYKWLNCRFFLKVIALVVIIFSMNYSYGLLSNVKDIKKFDPFEILDVDPEATIAQIKKAYRKLTLQYHPDKNADDPQARAKFILIAKAYEVLTDETAKENFAKYGSPDGPTKFQVGIAIPSFFLKKENHVLILAIFFLFSLIFIPSLGIYWYTESSKYDLDGNRLENKRRFYEFLNENSTIKTFPEVICLCEEFIERRVTSEEESRALKKLETQILPLIIKPKIASRYQKFLYLTSAYLMNLPIPDILQKDLLYLMEHAPRIIDGMIDIAQQLRRRTRYYKYMGLRCLVNLIEFKQLFIQGLWYTSESIQQMPFFSEEVMRKLSKKKSRFPSLLELQQEGPAHKFYTFFNEEEQKAIQSQLACFPNLTISTQIQVNGEENIHQYDIAKIMIKIQRNTLKDKQKAQYVHSLNYQYVKQENWYIIVCNEEKDFIMDFQIVNSQEKEMEVSYSFRASEVGEFKQTILLLSDSYRGLDQRIELAFTVKPPLKEDVAALVHEDDKAVEQQPSFFQNIMKSIQDENSDDELDDEYKEKVKEEETEENKEESEEREE